MTGRRQPAISFGARLRTLRKARGLTLRELEAASGIERGTINRIERDVASPRLDSLQALAAALKMTLRDLFKGL
jgi:XRE family transcriptional regulator, regulator of sulfur utilization